MILKKVLILLAFLIMNIGLSATIDAQLLIYQAYDYVQGPFRHQDKLTYPNNIVLVPEFVTVMFLQDDTTYDKIFSALKEKNPELYRNVNLEFKDDRPIIIINNTEEQDFIKIKNEVLASFRANTDLEEVEFVRNGRPETFNNVDYAIFTFDSSENIIRRGEAPIEETLLNLPLWISIALNIFLIIYLIITNRKNNKAHIKKGQ